MPMPCDLSGAPALRLVVDGAPGEFLTVLNAEGPDGQPVLVRIADNDSAPPEKDAPEGDEIVRRLRERRAEEAGETPEVPPVSGALRAIRERRAEAAEETAETETRPGTAAAERRRSFVGELARRAASIVAPARQGTVTFLGVGASPAPAVLTHQLRLPAGFGLVVDEVAAESPADKAGLKPFDLLQKLDDQLLVDERQLTALVHSRKPGETVTLTVVREGKPVVLKAKLGEREELSEGDQPLGPQVGEPPGARPPIHRRTHFDSPRSAIDWTLPRRRASRFGLERRRRRAALGGPWSRGATG